MRREREFIVKFQRVVVLLAGAWVFPHLTGISQGAPLDPVFAMVPFDRWLAEGGQGPFHWSAHVAPADLSNHQRLRVRVELSLDGSDLVSRRGEGYMMMLVQLEDADHRIYQSHESLDLQQVTEAAAKTNIVYTQDIFVRPGDYRVGLMVVDSKTGEHGAAEKTLHVNPLKNDPFPGAWQDLPAVEFVPAATAPDNLPMPASTRRLQLPLESRRPLRLEILVNVSPTLSQLGLHSGPANNRSLIELLPALNVMSQVEVRNGTLNVSLLDLTRRQVVFEQEKLGDLDWPLLRTGLGAADPNKIDVRSLAHRERNAQFFVEQVRERILGAAGAQSPPPGEPLRIGIVLSGPMGFASGEDLHPIEAAERSGRRIYYFRYHSLPPPLMTPPSLYALRGRRNMPPPLGRPLSLEPLDSLVPLIKPLQPRVFDIFSPEQFRKALSTMLEELSRL